MPKGGGTTYDYPYLRSCIKDMIENQMESGDIFFPETLAFMLTQYKGLSKKDKKKKYLSREGTLQRSRSYFIVIMNLLIKGNELRPIVRLRLKTHEEVTAICGRTKSTHSQSYYLVK
jgi:hypothetical protein